jgi:hypothetical protein
MKTTSAIAITQSEMAQRELIERICAAYAKAQESAKDYEQEYAATSWWQRVRAKNLSPVQTALASFDVAGLEHMYARFYRDPCSKGLIGWPRCWNGNTAREHIEEPDLHIMREETLYRLACWRAETHGQYPLSVLESPEVGEPFGVWVDGTFVATRAEYHHASACRTGSLARPSGTVVEIGGGYGGMAYYLLRQRSGLRYIDFDVPESLALAAYYLGNALPERTMVLCGEQQNIAKDLPAGAIVLLPPWQMTSLPDDYADITFSAHLLCDLQPTARERYLKEIDRFTSRYLLHWDREDDASTEAFNRHFQLMEKRRITWHLYRDPKAKEWDSLFQTRRNESALFKPGTEVATDEGFQPKDAGSIVIDQSGAFLRQQARLRKVR